MIPGSADPAVVLVALSLSRLVRCLGPHVRTAVRVRGSEGTDRRSSISGLQLLVLLVLGVAVTDAGVTSIQRRTVRDSLITAVLVLLTLLLRASVLEPHFDLWFV